MFFLITGAWREAKENVGVIEQMGHRVCFLQWEKEGLPCSYDDVEGVICNSLFLYHDIRRFSHLRYIQLMSAGYDRIDMDYAGKQRITVHNVGDAYAIPMAEYVLTGVLDLYKKRRGMDESQRRHQWNVERGIGELYGKRVLIVGCGNVGIECARRFQAFGCDVVGVNRTAKKNDNFREIVRFSLLNEILPNADIVVITIALTPETKHLFNEERLEMLSSNAILVNVARGELVDEKALMKRLPTLYGAVLDVFEEEPVSPESPLWDMENVLLSPHNSYIGEGNTNRLQHLIMKNLQEYGNS